MLQRLTESRLLRWGFLAVALAFGVLALVRYGTEVRAAASDLRWPAVVAAFVLGVASVFTAVLSWRVLLAGFGSSLSLPASMRIFFLSQLGKYVPGSIWPFVAQVELGREHGVPRTRSLTVGLLTVAINLIVALALAAAMLPIASPAAARRYWWVLVAAPLLIAALHPAVLNRLLDRMLQLAKRPPLESPLTGRTIVITASWGAVGWLLAGAHIMVLSLELGGHGGTLYLGTTGAYALAWSLGFLVVFAPAGLGVREVALTAGLAPGLGTAQVLVVVIASRLLMTAADLALAGFAVLLARRHAASQPDEMADAAAARDAARRRAADAAAAADPDRSPPVG